jgi:hypothetical protein
VVADSFYDTKINKNALNFINGGGIIEVNRIAR